MSKTHLKSPPAWKPPRQAWLNHSSRRDGLFTHKHTDVPNSHFVSPKRHPGIEDADVESISHVQQSVRYCQGSTQSKGLSTLFPAHATPHAYLVPPLPRGLRTPKMRSYADY